jgi:hypothetical protein
MALLAQCYTTSLPDMIEKYGTEEKNMQLLVQSLEEINTKLKNRDSIDNDDHYNDEEIALRKERERKAAQNNSILKLSGNYINSNINSGMSNLIIFSFFLVTCCFTFHIHLFYFIIFFFNLLFIKYL